MTILMWIWWIAIAEASVELGHDATVIPARWPINVGKELVKKGLA